MLAGEGDRYTVAVVGDGALTGGMAFEGLNNLGVTGRRCVVILNDNGMSISPNVGALSRVFDALRTSEELHRPHDRTQGAPVVEVPAESVAARELAAGEHVHAERPEVVRADGVEARVGVDVGARLEALHAHVVPPAVAGEVIAVPSRFSR